MTPGSQFPHLLTSRPLSHHPLSHHPSQSHPRPRPLSTSMSKSLEEASRSPVPSSFVQLSPLLLPGAALLLTPALFPIHQLPPPHSSLPTQGPAFKSHPCQHPHLLTLRLPITLAQMDAAPALSAWALLASTMVRTEEMTQGDEPQRGH